MSDHLSTHDLEQLLHKTAPLTHLSAASAHLAQCPACVERMRSLPAARTRVAALEHALAPAILKGHPEYEELESFVDQTLPADQTAAFEQHIAVCTDCWTQIDTLRTLAPVRAPLPNAAAAKGAGFFDGIRALLRPRPMVWGLGALCLAIGFYILFIYSSRTHDQTADVTTSTIASEEDIDQQLQAATVPGDSSLAAAPKSSAVPAAAHELRAAIEDGGQTVGVDDAGNVVGYEGVSSKYRDRLKLALSNGRIRVAPRPEELSTAPDPTMGTNDGENLFKIRGPAGKMLLTDKPTLSWQPLAGSDNYRVDIYDPTFNKVASSGELTGTAWSTQLARGKTYSWQVTAVKDGSEFKTPQTPQPAARFHIISSELASAIDSIKKQHPNSHLLLAIAYAEAGLRDEAVNELRILARQNPRSTLPKRLIGQLQNSK